MDKRVKGCRSIAAAIAAGGLAVSAQARDIYEDFLDAGGVGAFDPELIYDFGTSSDFTGSLDTHDLFPGELWLYADRVIIGVGSLGPGEYIESVTVTWTDFCGLGCTQLEVFGVSGTAAVGNGIVGVAETLTLGAPDIGGPIDFFALSSFEGRIEEFRVTIVPAPSAGLLMLMGGVLARRRMR